MENKEGHSNSIKVNIPFYESPRVHHAGYHVTNHHSGNGAQSPKTCSFGWNQVVETKPSHSCGMGSDLGCYLDKTRPSLGCC